MEPHNPVEDSLEDFYGNETWIYQTVRKCGAYRVPGGKVKCALTLMENGQHYGKHRGYDALMRSHTWVNHNSAAVVPPMGMALMAPRRPHP